ncbi:MAG TPA: DAK2 domain-containing protein [Propionibacteriaceae bacterium]|jgi:dihydroxyacetone kinase|nr:DAK2 domain-containing protein [Propionibacteriaceae bacterium]
MSARQRRELSEMFVADEIEVHYSGLGVMALLNLFENLGSTLVAALTGANSTRDLVASSDRASYVGEVARGILDPGAVAVALRFGSAVVTNGGQRPDTT